MSYTIEKINANIEETFVKKYGVCIDGGMPQTATGLEALCHRVYNKGWADCRERMLNKSWIPCSERLPEERNWYLAMFKEPDTDFMGLPMIADYLMGLHTNYTTEDGWIIANCTDTETAEAEYFKKLKCVAWMPLPEPYELKGEKDG